MGILLSDALKTMCGNTQWLYAVFWKIGCQNPRLLIWEECYVESFQSSNPFSFRIESPKIPVGEWERYKISSEVHSQRSTALVDDKVRLLINKMMLENQVNLVGEGIVGRAAFTGNHQWILSQNYNPDGHPSEVSNEVLNQFSAGIQTIAVIPALPHGVVQLGSSLAIMENVEFVHEVKSLICQLGFVAGALISDNYEETESFQKIGVPVSVGNSVVQSRYLPSNSSKPSKRFRLPSLLNQVCDSPLVVTSAIQLPTSVVKPHFVSRGHPANEVIASQEIPSNTELYLNQSAVSCHSRFGYGQHCVNGPTNSSASSQTSLLQPLLSNASPASNINNYMNTIHSLVTTQFSANGSRDLKSHEGLSNQYKVDSSCTHHATTGRQKANPSITEWVPSSGLVVQSTTNDNLPGGSGDRCRSTAMMAIKNDLTIKDRMENDLFQLFNIPVGQLDDCISEFIPGLVHDFHHPGNLNPGSSNDKNENSGGKHPSQDDLYDVLGVELKNKLLNEEGNSFLAIGGPDSKQKMSEDGSSFISMQEVNSNFFSAEDGVLSSRILGASSTDHLLDAVVSRACSSSKQSSEETVSCKTSLTKASGSSLCGSSSAYDSVRLSNQLRRELLDPLRSLKKVGTPGSSFISGCSKDDGANCSRTSSFYGSQISSWVEEGNSVNHDGNMSTAYCKRNDEMGKSNRKRSKPGENPRPRPKDRQMIQDRVKELREIVPNSGKCSIDALLERTIKHMLFLQSVVKHADKLKQTGESKIVNKKGGLILKDNFEGGATWAFELGSQSMVCPIIVEDLSSPRQMLVEMLCVEGGFFLEIADLIRKLGLTILKGVMEVRNDKIWAHFAVEANREITRMEIFMSLVHLLEQTASSTISLDNNNVMVH